MDVEFLERYLQDHPDSIMFARLADTYLGMKRVDEAIQLCEDGIKKHPYYATGHFILAKGYLANSLFEQAEKEFKRVLLFDPKYLGAHKLYGDLMREIGWENTYQLSYKKIMQFDPLEDAAREVVTEADEKTEEHDSTKDLSEFSLASSENVAPTDKSLDEQEHDWSQGSDWPEKPGWPEETELSDEAGAAGEVGWEDELKVNKPSESETTQEPSGFAETELDTFKDEPVLPPTPESVEPEPELFNEGEGSEDVLSQDAVDDTGLEAISPIPVTEEEEDLIFGDEAVPEIKPEPELDKSDVTIEPKQKSPEKVTEVDEDELDDKEAEEFSYILEDIFKDEVVEDKSATQNIQEQVSKEEAKSALDEEADSFMKNFQALDEEGESEPEIDKAAGKEKEDFPDFTKPPQDDFNFPEPEQPKFSPPLGQVASEPLSSEDDIESEDVPESVKPSAGAKKKSDKIVTPTLGEIYAAQGQYAKAIDVFEGLLKKHPDNESYNNKIQMLKKKLEEAGDA